MILPMFKISVNKIIVILITFYAALLLVIVEKNPFVDFGVYVSKELQLNAHYYGRYDSAETDGKGNGQRTNEGLQSTCSDRATQRGPHQRVVAFAYYGELIKNRNFFQGIEENAKLLEKFYPKWVMRVYTNSQTPYLNVSYNMLLATVNSTQNITKGIPENCNCIFTPNATQQEEMCHLQCIYPYLDFCYVKKVPGFGNLLKIQPQTWRFLPMADPLVDVFVSRDLDSRFSEREAAAVKEWLDSNLTFHVMRDHPAHHNPIMGGMWGAVLHKERNKLNDITTKIVDNGKKRVIRGMDQVFLKETLWPIAKGTSMQHDSFNCLKFRNHGNMNPWPTKRSEEQYNFVGSRIGVDRKPLSTQCPKSCRPKNKQKWIIC